MLRSKERCSMSRTAASTATGRTASAACPTRSRPTRRSRRSPADFFKQFNTDAKIIAVIRSGSVIGERPDREHAPLGRHHPPTPSGGARRLPEDTEAVTVSGCRSSRLRQRPIAAAAWARLLRRSRARARPTRQGHSIESMATRSAELPTKAFNADTIRVSRPLRGARVGHAAPLVGEGAKTLRRSMRSSPNDPANS